MPSMKSVQYIITIMWSTIIQRTGKSNHNSTSKVGKMIAIFAVGAKECYMCGSYDMADRPCSSFGAFGHRAEVRPCTNLTWHGKEIYPPRYYSDDDGFYCVKVSIINQKLLTEPSYSNESWMDFKLFLT